jgi:hypothetical protein
VSVFTHCEFIDTIGASQNIRTKFRQYTPRSSSAPPHRSGRKIRSFWPMLYPRVAVTSCGLPMRPSWMSPRTICSAGWYRVQMASARNTFRRRARSTMTCACALLAMKAFSTRHGFPFSRASFVTSK